MLGATARAALKYLDRKTLKAQPPTASELSHNSLQRPPKTRGVSGLRPTAPQAGHRPPQTAPLRDEAPKLAGFGFSEIAGWLSHRAESIGDEVKRLIGLEDGPRLSPGGVWLPTVRVDGPDLRIFLTGDTGTGNGDQMGVAASMIAEAALRKPHFMVNLGDLVYENGVETSDDPRLAERMDVPYADLAPMYAALGNHDHRGDVDAMVAHAKTSDTVVMPARYYGFTYEFAGRSADFFVLDTQVLEEDPAQLAWLAEKFGASTADYKIVLGHHPIHSGGSHGDTDYMKALVLPIIEGQAKLYASGHEHDQQVLSTAGGSLLLISGAGGKQRDTGETDRTHFAGAGLGFSALTLGQDGLQLDLLRAADRKVMYREQLGIDEAARPGKARRAPAMPMLARPPSEGGGARRKRNLL